MNLWETTYAARATDPGTSHAAAKKPNRRRGHKIDLLNVYARQAEPITDREAFEASQLPPRACWWKRCSELRQLGYITARGTRIDPETDTPVSVCRITLDGLRVLKASR